MELYSLLGVIPFLHSPLQTMSVKKIPQHTTNFCFTADTGCQLIQVRKRLYSSGLDFHVERKTTLLWSLFDWSLKHIFPLIGSVCFLRACVLGLRFFPQKHAPPHEPPSEPAILFFQIEVSGVPPKNTLPPSAAILDDL